MCLTLWSDELVAVPRRSGGWPWVLAVVALFGLTETFAEVRAAGVTAAGQVSAAVSQPARHHCRCGVDCGESCCCAPSRTANSPPKSPRPVRASADLPSGPCLFSSPCGGGPALPAPLPATPVTDEPAALTAHVLSLGLIPGERIELEPARRPLDPSLSIPPEPPEVPAIA